MSIEEQDQMVGRAIREYNEATKELNLLKEKARVAYSALGVLRGHLSDVVPDLYKDKGPYSNSNPAPIALTSEEVLRLAQEIRVQENRVRELTQRKADLGA